MSLALVLTILIALATVLAGSFANPVAALFQPRLLRNPRLLIISFSSLVLWVMLLTWAGWDQTTLQAVPLYLKHAVELVGVLVGVQVVLWVGLLVREWPYGSGSAKVPKPPAECVYGGYTLLTKEKLVGRKDELNRLTSWLAGTAGFSETRVLVVHALGGMGKSALTWTWFRKGCRHTSRLAGRMWWSFYAPDSSFDSFLTHALAYFDQRDLEKVANLSFAERTRELLATLHKHQFLLVLDGLERLMVQYNRMDAANLPDELDAVTGDEQGSADQGSRSWTSTDPRKLSDDRVAEFLRSCATEGKSHILVTSRLYPADLEKQEGGLADGCAAFRLTGLSDQDALALWGSIGGKGSVAKVRPYLQELGNQPLWVKILAGEVAKFWQSPGDFDAWLEENEELNPATLRLVQRKTHILQFAFQGCQRRRSVP